MLADSIVAKTLEIIGHLRPKAYLMENPQTGLLKTREVVAGLPFRDVSYCMYSDGLTHTYRKPTRLWGEMPGFESRPMCTRKSPCQHFLTGKHPCSAQRFGHSKVDKQRFTLNELYSMPQALTDQVAECAMRLAR